MKSIALIIIGLIFFSGCLNEKKDIFYIENLDTNSFDQNTIVSQTVLLSPTSNITMVDMPADRNEFPGASGTTQAASRFQLDLNRVSQYRINTFMGSTTATTTRMLLQFSDNNSTWYDANIGNEPLCCVLLAGGVGMKTSGWIDANQDLAQPGTFFRTILYGGNGTADVAIRNINVQFKVPVATHATITGGGSATDTNCSNNPSCVITGRINSGFDANVLDLNAVGDANITNSSATIPPLTINNTGSNTTLTSWMSNGLIEASICNAFGFTGLCFDSVNNPIGFFGFTNLTGYYAVAAGGAASAINDDVEVQLQAPITRVTQTFIGDQNINGRDLNIINTSNLNRLRVGNDSNFLRNARINDSLYVDKNIYADTFEKDLGIALNTCYVNGGKRDLHVYGNITSDLKNDNDVAYVELQTGTSCGTLTTVQRTGVLVFGANPNGIVEDYYYPFGFLVHDGNAFQITSTIAGSGSVSLDNVRGYYP